MPQTRYTERDILRGHEEMKRRQYGELVVTYHEGRIINVRVCETKDVKPEAA